MIRHKMLLSPITTNKFCFLLPSEPPPPSPFIYVMTSCFVFLTPRVPSNRQEIMEEQTSQQNISFSFLFLLHDTFILPAPSSSNGLYPFCGAKPGPICITSSPHVCVCVCVSYTHLLTGELLFGARDERGIGRNSWRRSGSVDATSDAQAAVAARVRRVAVRPSRISSQSITGEGKKKISV